MKRKICILLSIFMIILLSACSGKTESGGNDVKAIDFTLNYTYDSAYENLDQSVKDAYASLCKAVINYEPEFRVNESFVGDVCDLFNTSFPLSYLVKDISIREDSSGVTINYAFEKEEHDVKVNSFTEKMNEYISICSADSANDGVYLIRAYNLVASKLTYEGDNTLTCYDAVVNGKANENTFSKMFEYLAAQRGIGVYHINAYDAADNITYLSMAELDGNYYYFDVYGESQKDGGSGITLFGLNYTELDGLGIKTPLIYNMTAPPESLDVKFDVCRKAVSWSIEDNALLITTKSDDLVKLTF